MKKSAFILVLLIIFQSMLSFSAFAETPISVYCNGSAVSFEYGPYTINGTTMISLKDMGQALGFNCVWDEPNKTVIVGGGTFAAWVQINNPVIPVSKNGVLTYHTASVAPCMINGRTFVPVRTVADIYDGTVYWNSACSTVGIVTSSYDGSYQSPYTRIIIDGFTPPQTVVMGRPYVLSGTIHSAVHLNRVNVKIIDNATGITEINETDFDIQSCSYMLSNIDSRITFGKLSKGSKTLKITCVDAHEGRAEFDYSFSVSFPQGATVNSPVYMLWPVPSSGLITTIFWCDNPFCHSNAGRVNGHAAIDIAASEDASVIAVMDGVVEDQGFGSYENSQTGYGNFIRIDHGNGLKTQYSHLYSIKVTTGQQVKAGDIIGGVGNTGNSTGNHLDFYISQDGVRCDPLYYLDIPANARCVESCDVPFFKAALAARGIQR